MGKLAILCFLTAEAVVRAQTLCAERKTYTPCDLVFELTPPELAAHPDPFLSVAISAEVKSPRFRTFLLPAFWDGGSRFVIRFAPTEPGAWEWRLTSNIQRFQGVTGTAEFAESGALGFIKPANVHHWQYTENLKPHLWSGDSLPSFLALDRKQFEQAVDRRAEQKFNHLRLALFPGPAGAAAPFTAADKPNLQVLREIEQRLGYLNAKDIVADLVLGASGNQLQDLFPTWQQRERFLRYVAARYSAFNVTWQLVQEFETYKLARPLLKELGLLLMKHDPYNHPRTAGSFKSSGPLAPDGWMTFVVDQSGDDALGSLERQLFAMPVVTIEPAPASPDAFRKRLWNAAMNGQYPSFAGELNEACAKQMAIWRDVFANTRYWEIEPHFYVDGARAVALERIFSEEDKEGIEYIVYVENPRLIELTTIRHNYQVYWINPATGERVLAKKDKPAEWKGEKFVGEPPSKTGDWVLHLSRDGRKEGMLKSYKFDSRPVLLQEITADARMAPFEMSLPATVSLASPAKFEAKLTRQTRATRSMTYVWTGEVTADGQGYRVLGTGPAGSFRIPREMMTRIPAAMNVRLLGMNANGKIYALDRVITVTE